MERKRIFAISGVKNSGKTTLICKLLEIFKEKGLKVAVLKHDGHDFEPDIPGTDTYRQLQAGAYGWESGLLTNHHLPFLPVQFGSQVGGKDGRF